MSGRVVVTGASGFLGREVVRALARRGCEVHGLHRGDAEALPDARWHTVDLFDDDAVRSLLAGLRAEGLVHLAWVTRQGDYWTTGENLEWAAASLRLFRAFEACGGRRIVAAGTSAEYDWRSTAPFDEATTPLQPASLYGRCKDGVRRILESWAPAEGLSWGWGRIFNVFGPYEPAERLVPRVIHELASGRDLPFDEGRVARDFLHVSDAAEAFAALYASGLSGAVNVSSGEPVMIRQVVETIAATLDASSSVRFGAKASSSDEPAAIVGACERLRRGTGWSPAKTLQAGIGETCAWWEERRSSSVPRAR